QLGVGETARLPALVLGDERHATAVSGRDVMVDAVVREIGAPAAVPAECRWLPVQHALPLLEPRQRLRGFAPEALGVLRRPALPRGDLRIERTHAHDRA